MSTSSTSEINLKPLVGADGRIASGRGATGSVYLPKPRGDKAKKSRPRTLELWIGLAALTVFGVVIGSFAFVAGTPREAVAPGTVKTAGEVMVVQPLESGIVTKVLVGDGDPVRKGQPLLELEVRRAVAAVAAASAPAPRVVQLPKPQPVAKALPPVSKRDLVPFAIDEARWSAEVGGKREVTFPEWINDFANDARVLDRLVRTTTDFERARDAFENRQKRLTAQIGELHGRLTSHAGDPPALKIRVELAAVEQRLEELRATRRTDAERALSEVRKRIAVLDPPPAPEVTQPALAEAPAQALAPAAPAGASTTERVTLAADADGVVLYAALLQTGKPVKAGQTLLELHPAGQPQVIEATLDPADQSVAREGRRVEIRIPVAGSAAPAVIPGKIIEVAKDPIIDAETRQNRIPVRIEPLASAALRLDGATLQSGMHVNVVMRTSDQPLLDAIREPLMHGLDRWLTGSGQTKSGQ